MGDSPPRTIDRLRKWEWAKWEWDKWECAKWECARRGIVARRRALLMGSANRPPHAAAAAQQEWSRTEELSGFRVCAHFVGLGRAAPHSRACLR